MKVSLHESGLAWRRAGAVELGLMSLEGRPVAYYLGALARLSLRRLEAAQEALKADAAVA